MNYKQQGFTLLELMIVIIVIAILASIAIPAYSDYVTRARRADAKNALTLIQIAEEKWRANNVSYGSLAQIGVSAVSPDGYYSLSVTTTAASGATQSTYTATATPTGSQAGDTECDKFIVTNAGISAAPSHLTSCWNR